MDTKIFILGVPSNMACNNLCIYNKAPADIDHLLGLGAKYCLSQPRLNTKTIETMMKRTRNSICQKYIFRNKEDNNDYIPSLYIKIKKEPNYASDKIEKGMDNFMTEIKLLRRRHKRMDIHPNVITMLAGPTKSSQKTRD